MNLLNTVKRTDPSAPERTFRTEWAVGTTDDGYDVIVQLTTRHYGKAEYVGRPDRVAIAAIGFTQRKRNGRVTTERGIIYGQAHDVVAHQAMPRYSAKTLAALHADALATLTSTELPEGPQRVIDQAVELTKR